MKMEQKDEHIGNYEVSSFERLMEALRFAYSNNRGLVVEPAVVKTLYALLDGCLCEIGDLQSRVDELEEESVDDEW